MCMLYLSQLLWYTSPFWRYPQPVPPNTWSEGRIQGWQEKGRGKRDFITFVWCLTTLAGHHWHHSWCHVMPHYPRASHMGPHYHCTSDQDPSLTGHFATPLSELLTNASVPVLCAVLHCSVMSDVLWPRGLYSPSGSPVLKDSPGKNTGVGCHALLRGSSQPRDRTPVSCIADRFFTS